MSYSTEHIVRALKSAREEKGFSQRELSAKAGVPQGHISKIENGAVDLKLSSLIALARVLDLEIMPVPRKLVPAVQTLARTGEADTTHDMGTARLAAKQLKRIDKTVTRLAAGRPADIGEFARLQRAARELTRLHLSPKELEILRMAAETVKKWQPNERLRKQIQDAAASLERVRNRLVHRVADEPVQPARPAYSLDYGEDDA
jgi:transcriptional regulator with XRE-family HTH domain